MELLYMDMAWCQRTIICLLSNFHGGVSHTQCVSAVPQARLVVVPRQPATFIHTLMFLCYYHWCQSTGVTTLLPLTATADTQKLKTEKQYHGSPPHKVGAIEISIYNSFILPSFFSCKQIVSARHVDTWDVLFCWRLDWLTRFHFCLLSILLVRQVLGTVLILLPFFLWIQTWVKLFLAPLNCWSLPCS